jgi:uncharacterized membrane protein YebE (DUF533 family)
MTTFIDNVTLGLNHVQVLVRGMYSVARSDGVHATELVLLREFYESCRRDVQGLATFEEVVSVPLDEDTARDILNTQELRDVFYKSCLLLAFADGQLSAPERAELERLAHIMGLSEERRATLTEAARGYLLQQVAHIHNVDALRSVLKELS